MVRDERRVDSETFFLRADDELKGVGFEYPVASISQDFVDGTFDLLSVGNRHAKE